MEILLNGASVLDKVFDPPGAPTVRFTSVLNGRGTASFTIRDETGAYDPQCGQSVQIYDKNGVSRFGGTIEEIQKTLLDPSGGIELQITCVSHEQRLDKRIVQSKVYTSTTAGAVVTDLITSYADGENIFLSSPALVHDGATVDKIIYDYDKRLSEALDELATLSNFVWYVDPDGYLFFVPRTLSIAPWTLTGAHILDGSLSIRRSRSDLRTREWYRVNWSAFPPTLETFVGDGAATTFTLAEKVNRIERITLNGQEQSFGALGVDTGSAWYFSPGSDVITQDAGGTAITASDTLEVSYRALGADVMMADDLAAIAARAAAETGTGIYEHVTDDQNAVDATTALARAQSFVDAYKSIALTVEFSTIKAGLRPGQVLTAAVTTPPISGAWLVESVEGTLDRYCGEDDFRYSVRIIDGARIGGWLQFWEKLAGITTGGGGVSLGGSTYVPPEIPGAAPESNNVTGLTVSYVYPTDSGGVPDIAVGFTGDATISGIVVYDEPDGDQSAYPPIIADGSTAADGSGGAGGEWKPRQVAKVPYVAGKRVVYSFGEQITEPRTIRIYANTYNSDGLERPLLRAPAAGATPSELLTIQPQVKGAKGEEYCKNPTNLSCTVETRLAGGVSETHVFSTFSGPVGGDGAYVEVIYADEHGTALPANVALGAGGKAENWFPTPKTVQTAKVRARGYVAQFPGVEDDLVNTYERGITPEVEVTLGTTGGTVDPGEAIAARLAAAFSVAGKVLNLANNGITEDFVAAFAIAETALKNASVATRAIIDGNVTATKYQNLSVGTAAMGNLSVTAAILDNAAVTTLKVANGAIQNAALGALVVGTANIQDLAVSSAKMQDIIGKTLTLNLNGVTATVNNQAVGTFGVAGMKVVNNSTGDSVAICDQIVLAGPIGDPGRCLLGKFSSAWYCIADYVQARTGYYAPSGVIGVTAIIPGTAALQVSGGIITSYA